MRCEPTKKPENRYGCWQASKSEMDKQAGFAICNYGPTSIFKCEGCCFYDYPAYRKITGDIKQVQQSWSERWSNARVYGGSKI